MSHAEPLTTEATHCAHGGMYVYLVEHRECNPGINVWDTVVMVVKSTIEGARQYCIDKADQVTTLDKDGHWSWFVILGDVVDCEHLCGPPDESSPGHTFFEVWGPEGKLPGQPVDGYIALRDRVGGDE